MKALLPALLLVAAPTPLMAQGWICAERIETEGVSALARTYFQGIDTPLDQRPYLAIDIRGFSYEWKPLPRLLLEPFHDPAALAFPLRTERDPVKGSVVLTAPGERPIRFRVVGSSLWGSHVYHGPYLRLKNRGAVARMLSVPRWTATVSDRRGRVLEVTALESPRRDEVRSLYERLRAGMAKAARDPAKSPICDIDRTDETI